MVLPEDLLILVLHLIVRLAWVHGHQVLRLILSVLFSWLVHVLWRVHLEFLERRLLSLLILSIELVDDLDGSVTAAVKCALQLASVVEVVGLAREEQGGVLSHAINLGVDRRREPMVVHRVLVEAADGQERVRAVEPRIRHPLAHMNLLGCKDFPVAFIVRTVILTEGLHEEFDELLSERIFVEFLDAVRLLATNDTHEHRNATMNGHPLREVTLLLAGKEDVLVILPELRVERAEYLHVVAHLDLVDCVHLPLGKGRRERQVAATQHTDACSAHNGVALERQRLSVAVVGRFDLDTAARVIDVVYVEVCEDALRPVVFVRLRRVLKALPILARQVVDFLGHDLEDAAETALVDDEQLLRAKMLVLIIIVDVLVGREAIDVATMLTVPKQPLNEILDLVS